MGDVRPHSKRRVCYYYDEDIGTFYYGSGHPMKPQRIRMAHHLIFNYKLHRQMEILRPMKAPKKELLRFHTHDYLNFLKNGDKLNDSTYERNRGEFGIGPDCPLFKGVFEFSQLAAGGSLAGAVRLNRKMSDIAINWSGGLHHAKKSEAAGFCYVNDIVLAILELLKYHERVLYVDIDIHHGDGVEEAFYTTNRVMTVSFHKFGEFFPGTGTTNEIGAGKGKYYSVNFPLRDGMDDESYQQIFEPVMERVMDMYRPGAIVLECGADSLAGDRLGRFNLTIEGHSKCVAFMMKYNVPLLLLGGGGYTPVNVARCWTKETAVALGCSVEDNMPYHDYFERYLPDFKLSIRPLELLTNNNSREYLSGVTCRLLENLRNLEHAPGVQMKDIPDDAILVSDEASQETDTYLRDTNPETRISILDSDKMIARDEEFSDSEDEGDGERKNEANFKAIENVQLPARGSLAKSAVEPGNSDQIHGNSINPKQDVTAPSKFLPKPVSQQGALKGNASLPLQSTQNEVSSQLNVKTNYSVPNTLMTNQIPGLMPQDMHCSSPVVQNVTSNPMVNQEELKARTLAYNQQMLVNCYMAYNQNYGK